MVTPKLQVHILAELEAGLTPLTYFKQNKGLGGIGTVGFVWNMNSINQLTGWGSTAVFPVEAWRYVGNLFPGKPTSLVQRAMNFTQIFTHGKVKAKRSKLALQFSQSSSGPAAIQVGGHSFTLGASVGYSWLVDPQVLSSSAQRVFNQIKNIFVGGSPTIWDSADTDLVGKVARVKSILDNDNIA